MRVRLFANEIGLEVQVEDEEYNMDSDFISWEALAKRLAPHLPLPPAPGGSMGCVGFVKPGGGK